MLAVPSAKAALPHDCTSQSPINYFFTDPPASSVHTLLHPRRRSAPPTRKCDDAGQMRHHHLHPPVSSAHIRIWRVVLLTLTGTLRIHLAVNSLSYAVDDDMLSFPCFIRYPPNVILILHGSWSNTAPTWKSRTRAGGHRPMRRLRTAISTSHGDTYQLDWPASIHR